MDCCGHGHALAPRPWIWSAALTPVGAMLAGDAGPRGSTAAARDGRDRLCRARCSAQIHLRRCPYAWRQDRDHVEGAAERRSRGRDARGIAGGRLPGRRAGRPGARQQMRQGALAALRTPEPGELYRHHLERLAWMDEMVAHHGLRRALSAADLEAAHKAGQPAIIGDVEGSTFSRRSSNGSRKRTGAASGTCSSCTTRRTTSAISRPARSCTRGSPHSAPR